MRVVVTNCARGEFYIAEGEQLNVENLQGHVMPSGGAYLELTTQFGDVLLVLSDLELLQIAKLCYALHKSTVRELPK